VAGLVSTCWRHVGGTFGVMADVVVQAGHDPTTSPGTSHCRWPVLLALLMFDTLCYCFRIAARVAQLLMGGQGGMNSLARDFGPQLANMIVLYLFLGLLNRRSRRHGDTAARQEEVLISTCTGGWPPDIDVQRTSYTPEATHFFLPPPHTCACAHTHTHTQLSQCATYWQR
jgi:hypothetical protein